MEGPKILLLDIETQPDLVWTWGVYEQNAIEVHEHWQILSYSAKWLNGDHITKGLCDYKGHKLGGNDEKLVRDLWKLLDQADIVVAHNGKSFDIKKINARFIVHGLTPPSPYSVVDTKNEVKRVAGFSSNKLDWLCGQLGLGRKVHHEGFPLWKGCFLYNNKAAWAKMKRYNRHDVIILEKLYVLLSPWMKQPNAGLWTDSTICSNPACKSKDLMHNGKCLRGQSWFQRINCRRCGQRMTVPIKDQTDHKPLKPL